jgi:hypothetical protein
MGSYFNEAQPRQGMYKNFRVGVVKYFSKAKPNEGKPPHLLIEVIEVCDGVTGRYYSTYNLYVEVDRRFSERVGIASVGRWILFGFYVQSFKDESRDYITTLKLRHYDEIDDDNRTIIAIRESRNQESERTLIIPMEALQTATQITEQTQFNENGKR